MKHKNLFLFVTLCSFIMTGCTGSAPRDRYFRLSMEAPLGINTTPSVPAVLKVGVFNAKGLLNNEPNLLVRTNTSEVYWKEHFFWEEPPSVMVSDILTYTLRGSGIFENVVSSQVNVRTQYLLNGSLLIFEFDEQLSKVFIEMDLWISDLDRRNIVYAKQYKLNTPAADNSPESVIIAFNSSVKRLAAKVSEDIARQF